VDSENAEDEKSEEDDLNDELGGLIVSAGSQSPTQEPHIVVSMNTDMPESFAEPVVPEVSLLDANKQDGVKMGVEGQQGQQQRRPSHGFVVGATGDENPSLSVPTASAVVQEPEQGSSLGPSVAAPSAPGVTGAKTYANLFKSGLNTTGTTFTATRNPFPQRPSATSNTVTTVSLTSATMKGKLLF